MGLDLEGEVSDDEGGGMEGQALTCLSLGYEVLHQKLRRGYGACGHDHDPGIYPKLEDDVSDPIEEVSLDTIDDAACCRDLLGSAVAVYPQIRAGIVQGFVEVSDPHILLRLVMASEVA